MLNINTSYGGMPRTLPKYEPIITFADVKVGLKVTANKHMAPVAKGTTVTVSKIEGDIVYLDTPLGIKSVSQAEMCLWFKPSKNQGDK